MFDDALLGAFVVVCDVGGGEAEGDGVDRFSKSNFLSIARIFVSVLDMYRLIHDI